jgi:HSP20 family protein
LVVLVEIAGLKEGMFSFAVQDRRLIVSGVRQRAIRELRAFQQMEIRYGEFRSEVMLPWLVDRDRVTALYQEGFLRIELPRAEGQQIRMVNIENTPLDPLDPDEADHLATF